MIFNTVKAVADAASTTETPKAASTVCTHKPVLAPSVAAMPIRVPPDIVLASTRLISGPGVMNRMKHATVKVRKVVRSGRNVTARKLQIAITMAQRAVSDYGFPE